MSEKSEIELCFKNGASLKVDSTQESRDWTRGDMTRMARACDAFLESRDLKPKSMIEILRAAKQKRIAKELGNL